MAIREAVLADVPALLALEQRFPGDRISPRQFRYLLRRGHCDILIYEHRGRPAGDVVVLYRRGSRRARIYSLMVDPAYRGRGVGRALLGAAERRAAARGRDVMALEVRCDNRRAIDIYAAAGYATAGRIDDYYDDHAAALQMEKPLGGAARARLSPPAAG